MPKLEDLVLFEPANSALAFRESAYEPADLRRFLRDALALANAEVEGPRFLFIGVRDVAGAKRDFPGISAAAMSTMRRTLPTVLARAVGPPFKVDLRSLNVKDAQVALLCFSECDNAPYLLRKAVAGLPAGIGWLRRGTTVSQLTRADLERMFAKRPATTPATADVRIAFAGDPPRDDIELPVLDLKELPSALAATRLRQMLDAQERAKDLLGKTETRMSRILHAQIFGIEQPYEKHSEASLRVRIDKAKSEHAAADRHYELAVRAHKLELVAFNRGNTPLDNVVLRLLLPNVAGIGVADKLYSATGRDTGVGGGYPVVTVGKRVVEIEASIGSLPAGATVPVFLEPPRLWVREAAAGKSIALDYSVHARGLTEPLRDSLFIRIPANQVSTVPSKRRADRSKA